MNASYKVFKELDFYPTYYANLDQTVIQSHQKQIQELMNINKIQKMFLHDYVQFDPHITYTPIHKTFPITKDISTSFDDFHSWMNTGSDSVQIAIMLRYKTIYVIGVDGYIERIPEAKQLDGIVWEITETPKENPNYWFAHYQEKGERYNLPNAHTAHIPGWKKTINYCKNNAIQLLDLSFGNYTNIPKISYKEFINQSSKTFL